MLQDNSFRWIEEAKASFQQLKQAMSKPAVLTSPDFSKPFILECEASGRGVGVVLMQECKPIAFLSKALKGKTLDYSAYEKELLALVLSVQKWRPDLLASFYYLH